MTDSEHNKKGKFSWETFNMGKFFAETDRVAKILASSKEAETNSK